MLNFSLRRLRESHEGPWFFVDLSMMFLLVINLVWIIIDSLFAASFVQSGLSAISPAIVDFYQPIHRDFALIDLGFIAIFLIEFCMRWIVSVTRKEYHRWYFFPFIHWYDLIGCIPLGGARIFRFLRVFSILYRLQKYQIIDLTNTEPYRFVAFYYDVFVEEVSDRVVVKVLSDAQKDIAAGSPLIDDITHKVLLTRQHTLSCWAAAIIVHIGNSIADEHEGLAVRQHVQQSVGDAVRANSQVSTLRWLPMLGGSIENSLEKAVTDIVTQSIINLLQEITPEKINDIIKQGVNSFSSKEESLDKEVLQIIDECIELVKGHVAKKRWKDEFIQFDSSVERVN